MVLQLFRHCREGFKLADLGLNSKLSGLSQLGPGCQPGSEAARPTEVTSSWSNSGREATVTPVAVAVARSSCGLIRYPHVQNNFVYGELNKSA